MLHLRQTSDRMSSILGQLPNLDLKRTLAHTFPGFLLYVGLLLATDTLLFNHLRHISESVQELRKREFSSHTETKFGEQ